MEEPWYCRSGAAKVDESMASHLLGWVALHTAEGTG
jgi:hypothetical protein